MNILETSGDIAELLRLWALGEKRALDQLMPLVYPRLKSIAEAIGYEQPALLGIPPASLVTEAFLRIMNQREVQWEGSEHFYSLAARAMRQILSDDVRSRTAAKRGGTLKHVPLHEQLQWVSVNHEETLDLYAALDELREMDARKVRVMELRYFLGCTADETADVLGISKATVDREAEVAREWLSKRLRGEDGQAKAKAAGQANQE